MKFIILDETVGRWILLLGPLSIGFGPVAFIERIWWGKRGLIYGNRRAYLVGVARRALNRK